LIPVAFAKMMFEDSSGKTLFALHGDPDLETPAERKTAVAAPVRTAPDRTFEAKEDANDLSRRWREHENASRVTLWMISHEKFAMQADYMSELIHKDVFGMPELDNLKKAWHEHSWAVSRHSDFEEARIFPNLLQGLDKNERKAALSAMRQEHAAWEQSRDLIEQTIFVEKPTPAELARTLRPVYIKYVLDLKRHVKSEEDTYLRRWLELGPIDYALFFASVVVGMIGGAFE